MIARGNALGWWLLKMGAGAALVGLVAERFLAGVLPTWPAPPTRLAQAVVVAGALVTVFHYGLLRRWNARVAAPERLLTRGGLFARVRHPMYLGDLIVYAGLALLAAGPAALAVFALAGVAIQRHARLEDAWLARRFGASHARWRERTGLLLPGA